MNNIFKNAKFGKVYKTRDGRKAIYIQTYRIGEIRNELVVEDEETGRRFYLYKDDGSFYHKETCEDIISEWKEPIDEEKLDKLAEEYCTLILKENHNKTYGFIFYDIKDAFKAGFRHAKEIKI